MAEGGDQESNDEVVGWINEIPSADVVIFYTHENEYRISKTILSYLTEGNIKYIHPEEHFTPGGREIEDIAKAISKSRKTLIILSKKRKEHLQFSLEIYLALEQGMRTNEMTVMILLIDGMTRDDVPEALPVLKHACQMELIDNLHERCMDQLCSVILQPPLSLSQRLPAGNFAVGMAWSHFAGYLRNILPALPAAIKKSDFFQDNVGRMSTCFFMLCPLSARGHNKISDADSNLEYMGHIDVPPYYKPSVYKVKIENEKGKTEEYYVCAEYPSAMLAIGHICDQALALLSPQERRLEVQRFRYKLEEIINHHNNPECNGRAKCIVFDDESKGEEGSPSHQLGRSVKEAISEGCSRPLVDSVHQSSRSSLDRSEINDVCFLYCDDGNQSPGNDNSYIFSMRRKLEEKRLRCAIARLPKDPPVEIQSRIEESRWIAVLLSRDAMRHSYMMNAWLISLLKDCIQKNKLRILVLLRDVEAEKIPDFIHWVTYIDTGKEPDYVERIEEILKGMTVSMDSQVPVGDVSFGLAWAFHVNYLRHVLPDISERIQQRMGEDDIRKMRVGTREVKLSKYLLEIVPKSCRFHRILTEIDDKIEGPYDVKSIEKHLAGTKKVIPCKLYRIQGTVCDYYFAGEIFAPVKALKAMHESMIGGLSNSQMNSQREKTATLLRSILESKATPEELQNKCKIINYDDESSYKRDLSDVIKDEIEHQGSEVHLDNYGKWLQKQKES
ncbi:hypothetical protein FSP39_025505 [Pinctada imbricata]|uniref:TIR domain-containing protein n=1 Tax=Pinctada imbricata TaxID=66713 RepID=A0AA88Y287_PINIB|nr:hypothetical protein FSP39_025505 [Pinctada imbricata]